MRCKTAAFFYVASIVLIVSANMLYAEMDIPMEEPTGEAPMGMPPGVPTPTPTMGMPTPTMN